jgi:hypothetical protein
MSEWVFAADWVKRRRIYVSGLVIGACVVLGCLLLLNFPVDDLFSRNGLMVGLVITGLLFWRAAAYLPNYRVLRDIPSSAFAWNKWRNKNDGVSFRRFLRQTFLKAVVTLIFGIIIPVLAYAYTYQITVVSWSLWSIPTILWLCYKNASYVTAIRYTLANAFESWPGPHPKILTKGYSKTPWSPSDITPDQAWRVVSRYDEGPEQIDFIAADSEADAVAGAQYLREKPITVVQVVNEPECTNSAALHELRAFRMYHLNGQDSDDQRPAAMAEKEAFYERIEAVRQRRGDL